MWCTMDRCQHRLPTVGPTIGSFSATPASTARDLGVYIDTDLSMRSHVRRTVSRCFATLRQICTIRRQVPTTVFQSLVTALVLPHLDYCSSVLYGLPTSLIQRLQSVQNATARLIFGLWRSEHISPALISLHWLHIPERISFKLAVLTYRAVHGAGPSYFQSCFTRVADMPSRRRLHSLARTDHSSIHSWQSNIHSFQRRGMERPAGSRHSCVVTRSLQTAPQDISVLALIP